MLDYTDISSKVEDVKNALNNLYELAYSQYDGIFQGEDAKKYQRMLQNIKSADRCMNEVNELNNRLSDAFEANIEVQATEFLTEARACAER